MRVVVTGGTGFIGRALVTALHERGDAVTVLSRDAARARAQAPAGVRCASWDPASQTLSDEARAALAEADAVVNLAGEPVLNARWNDAVRAEIRESRVASSRLAAEAMLAGERRPERVFVNSSGIDYYGNTGDTPVDEGAGAGVTFLAQVCIAWEGETARVAEAGLREVRVRTGIVLGERGGALERMLLPFKLFVGGPLGAGEQFWAWISLRDMVAVLLRAIDDPALRGAVNAVSPTPVRVREFTRVLGRVLRRPSWASVPGFALRAALGEGGAILLESKRILPRALQRVGFEFRDVDLEAALRALLTPAAA